MVGPGPQRGAPSLPTRALTHDERGVTRMTAPTVPSCGPAGAVGPSGVPVRGGPPLDGGGLLALAMSLRARGLRGLDVLRRSQDRAPPASA